MSIATEFEHLDEIYAFAIRLARAAGGVLMDCAGTLHTSSEKDSSVDIVTAIDEKVELLIRTEISRAYPDHKFLGEESYSKGESRVYLIDEEPTWCVDPLDGTVNYVHRFPMFCVSIALVIKNKPIIGVVYAPAINYLFSACQGKGAWLNETQRLPLTHDPVPPLPANSPTGCIFSCEWGKDRRDSPDSNMHRKIESFTNMAAVKGSRGGKGAMVHGVRSLGSATLDLAYTAMGSFDIWWEGGCWEWDVAAGICLLQEAGGLVTTANDPEDPDAEIPEAHIGSRLYLAIRPAGNSATETGRQAQERTVREVWKRVRNLDYTRPGI